MILIHGLCDLFIRNRLAEVIVRAIPGNRPQPGSETRNVAQSMKLAQGQKKNFLNEVINFAWRNAREQDAVNHARVAVVQTSEGGTIAIASGADERVFVAGFGGHPLELTVLYFGSRPSTSAGERGLRGPI